MFAAFHFFITMFLMHEFVWYNEKSFRIEEVSLPVVSSAALYGKGIFTTVAIIDKKPFLWEKHWRRLNENSAKIKLDISAFSEEKLKNALIETIEKNNCSKGRARITIFDESPNKIWSFESKETTGFLITTANSHKRKTNLRLTVSPYEIDSKAPLAGVKSCNYLANLIALEEAKERGFDEAIQLDQRGNIVSACMANIFWLKNGNLFTPLPETGCLRGTMREFLMEKFDVTEVESPVEVLFDCDAVFLTSAGIGVVQIVEFETKVFSRNFNEITQITDI